MPCASPSKPFDRAQKVDYTDTNDEKRDTRMGQDELITKRLVFGIVVMIILGGVFTVLAGLAGAI
jgi:hypothetical protein